MSCHHEGSTHFACECVLEQLRLADELAKAAKARLEVWTEATYLRMKEALGAYEKVRVNK